MYKIIEVIKDTIPSYETEILPESYNESLLKKTDLTRKENKDVMKKLKIDIV